MCQQYARITFLLQEPKIMHKEIRSDRFGAKSMDLMLPPNELYIPISNLTAISVSAKAALPSPPRSIDPRSGDACKSTPTSSARGSSP
mmetsp:Transcript_24142/g.51182  ORF Transcript_24142/g.51182 Transcript_24142/m.51182 type:complete len:88 (+) Transcript_24142:135-398(+)